MAFYQSCMPRFVPCTPDAREVEVLTETFQNLFMAVRAVIEERIFVDWDKGEILWRAYNEKTGLWNMFAESIPMVEREYPLIVLQDEVLRRRLKKGRKWEQRYLWILPMSMPASSWKNMNVP